MMKTSHLDIGLLGPVEISYNGERLNITRRVERGVLYYLAVENRPVSRTNLIDLLWPEAEQLDPRGTLRTALSRLRKTLPDKNFLVTELDQVALDINHCQIDLLKFEESYQSLQGILAAFPSHTPLPIQIVKQIEVSLDLWHGDRVIEGDDLSAYPALDEWRITLNKSLSQHREILIKRLAENYQASGQLERALDLFYHLSRLNSLENSYHLTVLDLFIKLGRYYEVMEFCDALEGILEREYNAPLPEEIIKRCRYSQERIKESQRLREQDWPLPLSMQLPLVGRTAELKQLRGAFFRGGLIKIEGEMGVGKTRLVQELFEILSPKPLLFVAPARESERSLPLAPIIHGLRRHIPDEIWHAIDAVWANQLSHILPEMTEVRGDLSPSFDQKWPSSKQHLFDAIHYLLDLVAKKFGRILFFLDDAQWVDLQTTEVLSYLLAQGFFEKHGVLIIAVRLREDILHVDRIINQHHRTRPVQVITLSGLNPGELRSLIQHVLNQPLAASFLDGLYRETKGIPFWALEIVRHLLDVYGDNKALQDIPQFPLTESAHTFIRNRFYQFGEDLRTILTCAAVIGDDISFGLLQAVSGISQHDFLLALDSLIRSGFLRADEGDYASEEIINFTHDKLREVVNMETTSAYRKILHQRVARELSRSPRSMDRAAVIAEHFRAGSDAANAFHWHLKAAAHAWSFGASEDALFSYQQAEAILNNTSEGIFSLDDILQLYKQWSNYAFQSNQVAMLEEVGVKLGQYGRETDNPLLRGVSNLSLANASFLRDDFVAGDTLIQEAVKDLEAAENQEALVKALFHQVVLKWWMLDFDQILPIANRLSQITDNLDPGSPHKFSERFSVNRMIAEVYYGQGKAKKALEIAKETYRDFFNKLDTFDRLRAHNMMAYIHFITGEIDKCIYYAQEGLKITGRLENVFIEELLLIILSKAEIVQGHLDQAYQHAHRVLALGERNHKIHTTIAANTLLGDINAVLQNDTVAMRHYRIAQVRQGFSVYSYYGQDNNIHLGRLLTRIGQLAEAKEIIRSTLDVTDQKGIMLLHAQALMADGLIDMKEGNITSAEEKFVLALELAEERGMGQEVLWGKFRMAFSAFSGNRFDLAESFLVEVLDKSKSHKMHLLHKYALELASQLSQCKTLQLNSDEIRMSKQSLVDKLEAHTQSEPLREGFVKAQRIWQKGYDLN